MSRTEKSIFSSVALAVVDIVILVCTSFALYKSPVKTPEMPTIEELRFSIELLENDSPTSFSEGETKRCAVEFTTEGSAETGFAKVKIGGREYCTEAVSPGTEFAFRLCGCAYSELEITAFDGAPGETETLIKNGKDYAFIGEKLVELSVFAVEEDDDVYAIAERFNSSGAGYKTSVDAIRGYNYIFDEEDFSAYYSEVVIPPEDFVSEFIDTLPTADEEFSEEEMSIDEILGEEEIAEEETAE